MSRDVSRFLAPDFLSLTIGIVVYFVGVLITQRIKFLQNFSIPEPVSGGFIAGLVISLVYLIFNLEIDFDFFAGKLISESIERIQLHLFPRSRTNVEALPIGWRQFGYHYAVLDDH